MKKYLVDTDILIDCLRKKKNLLEFLQPFFLQENSLFFISTLTIAELFSGKSAREKKTQKQIIKFIDCFQEVSLLREIAIKAGQFRYQYKISLSDAIIAATAFFLKATLITFNSKHFSRIKEIKVISPPRG